MNETVIYDSNGVSTLRILTKGRIVDFNGRSIGFLKNTRVYDYNGTHRGFFEGGILRDHSGATVGFTDNVTSLNHPILPLKQIKPLKGLTEIEPLRPFTEMPPLKPLRRLDWSGLTPLELFGL
jgi:hypothetical protein